MVKAVWFLLGFTAFFVVFSYRWALFLSSMGNER